MKPGQHLTWILVNIPVYPVCLQGTIVFCFYKLAFWVSVKFSIMHVTCLSIKVTWAKSRSSCSRTSYSVHVRNTRKTSWPLAHNIGGRRWTPGCRPKDRIWSDQSAYSIATVGCVVCRAWGRLERQCWQSDGCDAARWWEVAVWLTKW